MRIAAGIVLYNPNIQRLQENIDAVILQCPQIYLVDNASDNLADVRALLEQYSATSLTLLCNAENAGIAKALNQLTAAAQNDGYAWILTLDQDSVAPSNIIEEFGCYMDRPSVGMLCPVIYDRNKGQVVEAGDGCREVDVCITSGSLLNIDVWQEIGGFDEKMFIDNVDFDICYRLREAGYHILEVQSCVLLHELGHMELRRCLFWKVLVKNHPAFRKYYIARNTIYLARKEHTSVVKAILQSVKMILIAVLYEEDKWNKVRRIVRGTIEGFTL